MIRRSGTASKAWGVFARIFVLDDAMYELAQLVLPWLARWSLAQGWIGFAREELDPNPWLHFYAARGHAYASAPGKPPEPLCAGAAVHLDSDHGAAGIPITSYSTSDAESLLGKGYKGDQDSVALAP